MEFEGKSFMKRMSDLSKAEKREIKSDIAAVRVKCPNCKTFMFIHHGRGWDKRLRLIKAYPNSLNDIWEFDCPVCKKKNRINGSDLRMLNKGDLR